MNMLKHQFWHTEKLCGMLYHLEFFSNASNLVACRQVDECVYFNNAHTTLYSRLIPTDTGVVRHKLTAFSLFLTNIVL